MPSQEVADIVPASPKSSLLNRVLKDLAGTKLRL